MRRMAIAACVTCAAWAAGCSSPQRTVTVTTEPSGAVVYINGLDETLRSPGKYDFEFYGDYEIIVRKEGYETLITHRKLKAPWFEIAPIDLFADLLGAKDLREWHFVLAPSEKKAEDPQVLINRAQALAADLESSKYTRQPATQPTTRPTTRPSARPTTRLAE